MACVKEKHLQTYTLLTDTISYINFTTTYSIVQLLFVIRNKTYSTRFELIFLTDH